MWLTHPWIWSLTLAAMHRSARMPWHPWLQVRFGEGNLHNAEVMLKVGAWEGRRVAVRTKNAAAWACCPSLPCCVGPGHAVALLSTILSPPSQGDAP